MNISAKAEYACLAMLELALRHAAAEPVRIRDIAESHNIPSQFLIQILLQLKNAGLVNSVRGASGGYLLAREPSQISLSDILSTIDRRFADPPAAISDTSPTAKALYDTWSRVAQAQRDMLQQITLEELSESANKHHVAGMYYI